MHIRILVLFAAMLLSGCALLAPRPAPPGVALAGLVLTEANLFEQRFLVKLRLSNPNGFDLPLNGLRYRLDIGDQPLMEGNTVAAALLPANGSAIVELDARTQLMDVIRQIRHLTTDNGKLRYRIVGEASVSGAADLRLPFDRQGEFDPEILRWLQLRH